MAQDTSSCQTIVLDTVMYVENVKTSSLTGISVNETNDPLGGGAYGYAGYAQRFEAPDSLKLNGFCFYGFVYSGTTGGVAVCRLYDVDGSGMPNNQIDSVLVPVPLIVGYSGALDSDVIKLCANFGSGHVLEGDYIITVENFTNTDMYLARNTDGDGANEDLAYTYYKGVSDPTYDGWYKTLPFGSGWNFDLAYEPIVEHTISTEIVIQMDSICDSDTLMAYSSVTSFDDSIFYHRMYNPNYTIYNGYNVSTGYDYGDGNSDGLGAHLYAAGGSYTVTATDTVSFGGWMYSEVEANCSGDVYVGQLSVNLGSDTALCNHESITLDAGSYDDYMWNTGQMTQTIVAGPTVGADTITYYVDVNGGGCSASDSITVVFDDCTDIEQFTQEVLSIYPNPANASVNLELNENGLVEIYNGVGQLMYKNTLGSGVQTIDVSALENGVYVLVVNADGKLLQQKLQIVR